MYKLSIITVTFNDLEGLKVTIDSIDKVLNNNFFSVVHCIIDGNSSDGTSLFLNNSLRFRKIPTFFVSDPDLGIYDAMNKGVLFSESDFVIFINAGDILLPEILNSDIAELLDSSLEDPFCAGIAFGCMYNFNGFRIRINPRCFNSNFPRMPSLHQGIIYKRSVLVEIPYSLKYKICSDFENVCKICAKYNFRIKKVFVSELFAGGVSTKSPFFLFSESFDIYIKLFTPNFLNKIVYMLKLIFSLLVVQVLFKFSKFF